MWYVCGQTTCTKYERSPSNNVGRAMAHGPQRTHACILRTLPPPALHAFAQHNNHSVNTGITVPPHPLYSSSVPAKRCTAHACMYHMHVHPGKLPEERWLLRPRRSTISLPCNAQHVRRERGLCLRVGGVRFACEVHAHHLPRGGVEGGERFNVGGGAARGGHRVPHLGGEHLAELHAPLVEGVDVPHKALHVQLRRWLVGAGMNVTEKQQNKPDIAAHAWADFYCSCARVRLCRFPVLVLVHLCMTDQRLTFEQCRLEHMQSKSSINATLAPHQWQVC